jgi:hypothetical protein
MLVRSRLSSKLLLDLLVIKLCSADKIRLRELMARTRLLLVSRIWYWILRLFLEVGDSPAHTQNPPNTGAGNSFTALWWGVAQVAQLSNIRITMASSVNGNGHSGIRLGRGSTLTLADIRVERGQVRILHKRLIRLKHQRLFNQILT